MSVETRHAGLTADNRSEIRSTVLETRELIEDDFFRKLQRYGIYEDERVNLDQLGHLDTADKEIRETVDAALDRELEATEGDYHRSIQNFVRETTKTELNRLVALKAIEVRGLVSETLTERPEYGHRSEMLRAVDEVAGELTEQPDGGMGIALSLAFDELSDEIGVIFDESEHTAIELDFAVRADVIDALNNLDQTIWESDEAMGWVYQYFGEKERDEIDERIDEENYKVQDTDVATKTQLFTPRYIVEWMVDNSLGRLWLEMHGETTSIDDEDKCFYLAPLDDSLIERQLKDVRDIKVLDPACGSGHMLFYAFDVLYEMYLEQGNVPEKYIPREILKNNLYGIDIDPGAAQLAALALYVKAKGEEPDVEIEGINIVSADAVLVNGEKKDEVLNRTGSDLERRVLEEVWTSFEHIREWGSLVRIEERIEKIIEEEFEEVQATGQARFADDGLVTQSSVVSYSGEEETWEQVKARLLDQVSELAEEALEQNDPIVEMFVGEVEKSVRLLDCFRGDYDVVVTNPPYLGSKKMGARLKQFIKDNYLGTRNAYTAFIQRCWEFAREDGYASLVTPEDFMFLYSYRHLRSELIRNTQFIEGAHLSRYGFDQQKDAYTIPFILRNRDPSVFESSRFYRMTHEQENYARYEDKIQGLNEITEAHRNGREHKDVYSVDQNTFAEIDRTPFVYWFGREILDLFDNYDPIDDYADVVQGLATGDDDRFTRCWWEVTSNQIGKEYSWLVMSGTDEIYCDSPERVVLWTKNGKEIKQYEGSRPQNEEYYQKPGITFRRSSKRFTARLHPEGYIFSNQAHFIDINQKSFRLKLTVYLCSSLVRFIQQGLNPGLDFQVGDGKRVPTMSDEEYTDRLKQLAKVGIQIRRNKCALNETKKEFRGYELVNVFDQLLYYNDLYNADIKFLHGIVDHLIFDEYDIGQHTRDRIYQEMDSNLAGYPHVVNAGELTCGKYEFRSEVDTIRIPEQEFDTLVAQVDLNADKDIHELSEDLEVSPYTVAKIRRNHSLYTSDEKSEAAGRLLSYYLGCIMGRWELDQLEPAKDGIIVFDENSKNNVGTQIRKCFEITYGQDELYKRETQTEEMLGKSHVDWLRETFFRYHHCKEYRRHGQRVPIYWHLESDGGAFSCFVYYHKLNEETLPKLRGKYLDKKLDMFQNRLDAIDAELDMADGDRARDLRSEREEVQADIDDIREFRERVDRLIDEGFAPDFEAGIWENIQKVDEHDLLAVPLDKL